MHLCSRRHQPEPAISRNLKRAHQPAPSSRFMLRGRGDQSRHHRVGFRVGHVERPRLARAADVREDRGSTGLPQRMDRCLGRLGASKPMPSTTPGTRSYRDLVQTYVTPDDIPRVLVELISGGRRIPRCSTLVLGVDRAVALDVLGLTKEARRKEIDTARNAQLKVFHAVCQGLSAAEHNQGRERPLSMRAVSRFSSKAILRATPAARRLRAPQSGGAFVVARSLRWDPGGLGGLSIWPRGLWRGRVALPAHLRQPLEPARACTSSSPRGASSWPATARRE